VIDACLYSGDAEVNQPDRRSRGGRDVRLGVERGLEARLSWAAS
jgi:hypothetical protein